MLRKIYFCLVMILLLLSGLFFGGGIRQSEISREDLKLVNAYVSEAGADPISLETAEEINHWLLQNTQTREIKTSWQLVVDYVRNEQGAEPEPLGYAIVFEGSSFGIEGNEVWEPVGA
jgi:hypothetical protein